MKGSRALYVVDGRAGFVFGQSQCGVAISKSHSVGKVGFDIPIVKGVPWFSKLSPDFDQLRATVQACSIRIGSPDGIALHASIRTKYSIINIRNIAALLVVIAFAVGHG